MSVELGPPHFKVFSKVAASVDTRGAPEPRAAFPVSCRSEVTEADRQELSPRPDLPMPCGRGRVLTVVAEWTQTGRLRVT